MPALSVCCSPEGGPLADPLHNAGNCLLRRDSADICTECEINLAMISLICSQWLPPQVKGASASRPIHSSDLTSFSASCCSHCGNVNGRSLFTSVSTLFCFFFLGAPNMQCSSKHLSRMCSLLNGSRDLFRPRRYRCNRYESHLEPGSENATRCFIKNKRNIGSRLSGWTAA